MQSRYSLCFKLNSSVCDEYGTKLEPLQKISGFYGVIVYPFVSPASAITGERLQVQRGAVPRLHQRDPKPLVYVVSPGDIRRS